MHACMDIDFSILLLLKQNWQYQVGQIILYLYSVRTKLGYNEYN